MINRITFTGADDGVDPSELLMISQAWPMVEWGILFSRSKPEAPRYPSQAWLRELARVYQRQTAIVHDPRPMLSAHLCGAWMRDVLIGRVTWWQVTPSFVTVLFQRVQLNFSQAQGTEIDVADLGRVIEWWGKTHRFIFQCGTNNADICRRLVDLNLGDVLFDASGGAGVKPERWPPSWPSVYCGYAGGLRPENLTRDLLAIDEMTGRTLPSHVGDKRFPGQPAWIDMESGVRSDVPYDSAFDLDKVRDVIEQAATLGVLENWRKARR